MTLRLCRDVGNQYIKILNSIADKTGYFVNVYKIEKMNDFSNIVEKTILCVDLVPLNMNYEFTVVRTIFECDEYHDSYYAVFVNNGEKILSSFFDLREFCQDDTLPYYDIRINVCGGNYSGILEVDNPDEFRGILKIVNQFTDLPINEDFFDKGKCNHDYEYVSHEGMGNITSIKGVKYGDYYCTKCGEKMEED